PCRGLPVRRVRTGQTPRSHRRRAERRRDVGGQWVPGTGAAEPRPRSPAVPRPGDDSSTRATAGAAPPQLVLGALVWPRSVRRRRSVRHIQGPCTGTGFSAPGEVGTRAWRAVPLHSGALLSQITQARSRVATAARYGTTAEVDDARRDLRAAK